MDELLNGTVWDRLTRKIEISENFLGEFYKGWMQNAQFVSDDHISSGLTLESQVDQPVVQSPSQRIHERRESLNRQN